MGTCMNSGNCYFLLYFRLSYCCLCLFVICVSYTSVALKFWCGTRPPFHGAANRQRKLTVTLFIMTIVSLLLWLPYVVYTFVPYSVLDRLSFLTYLRLRLSFSLLYRTNSLVNPIIYTIRMPAFRRDFTEGSNDDLSTMPTIALLLHERPLENSSSMHSFITNFGSIKRLSYDLEKWFR